MEVPAEIPARRWGKTCPSSSSPPTTGPTIEEEAREAALPPSHAASRLFMSELRRCLCSVVDVAEELSEEIAPEAQKAPAQIPPQFHTGRILLAEDNELNQEIATK